MKSMRNMYDVMSITTPFSLARPHFPKTGQTARFIRYYSNHLTGHRSFFMNESIAAGQWLLDVNFVGEIVEPRPRHA
jgi:hypothetical protein